MRNVLFVQRGIKSSEFKLSSICHKSTKIALPFIAQRKQHANAATTTKSQQQQPSAPHPSSLGKQEKRGAGVPPPPLRENPSSS